jgi:hypothetical protein
MLAWVALARDAVARPDAAGRSSSAATTADQWLHQLGMLWLALGVGALRLPDRSSCSSARTCAPASSGASKIITDPFHDVMLYWRAPLYLLRGELLDPMAR